MFYLFLAITIRCKCKTWKT